MRPVGLEVVRKEKTAARYGPPLFEFLNIHLGCRIGSLRYLFLGDSAALDFPTFHLQ